MIRGDLIRLFKFIKLGDVEEIKFSTANKTRGHGHI